MCNNIRYTCRKFHFFTFSKKTIFLLYLLYNHKWMSFIFSILLRVGTHLLLNGLQYISLPALINSTKYSKVFIDCSTPVTHRHVPKSDIVTIDLSKLHLVASETSSPFGLYIWQNSWLWASGLPQLIVVIEPILTFWTVFLLSKPRIA